MEQYEDPATIIGAPPLQLIILPQHFDLTHSGAMSSSLLNEADDPSFTSFHNIMTGKPRRSEKASQTVNPATLEKLWVIPVATEQDVEDAVTAAKNAFKTRKNTSFEERVELLKVWGDA
jgi:delta 1-pyrroline-5-carboxylate dehydrogenase